MDLCARAQVGCVWAAEGCCLECEGFATGLRRYHRRASKKTILGGCLGGVVFFFDVFFSANEFAINAYQLSANAWWRRNCIFQCVLIYTVLL